MSKTLRPNRLEYADEPAFPVVDPSGDQWPGMTKREEFAKAALTGIMMRVTSQTSNEECAQEAWDIADAMCAERRGRESV